MRRRTPSEPASPTRRCGAASSVGSTHRQQRRAAERQTWRVGATAPLSDWSPCTISAFEAPSAYNQGC
eukprot:894580-Prymnesium_polylepis.2